MIRALGWVLCFALAIISAATREKVFSDLGLIGALCLTSGSLTRESRLRDDFIHDMYLLSRDEHERQEQERRDREREQREIPRPRPRRIYD